MNTIPLLSDLSPEQKRVLIAEAVGWKRGTVWDFEEVEGFISPCGKFGRTIVNLLPDYLTDLNAMAEAEKVLICDPHDSIENDARRKSYRWYLDRITKCRWTWHATAAQRADALLLSLSLAR